MRGEGFRRLIWTIVAFYGAMSIVVGVACQSSPVVGRVESEAQVFAAFDLETIFIHSNGAANVALFSKLQPGIPIAAASTVEAQVVVLKLTDPTFEYRGRIGEPIPPEAETYVRQVLTEAQVDRLGLTFYSGD